MCLDIVADIKGEIIGSCSEDGQVKITSLFGDVEIEQKIVSFFLRLSVFDISTQKSAIFRKIDFKL